MTVLKVTSRTDSQGELHLKVGVPDSTVQVTVTVDEQQTRRTDEELQKEWEAFVRRTAGSIADPSFKRQEQGEYPAREPLT